MEIKKVLILEFNRIGDTLMHEPALRALKLHYPKAKFYALTDRPNFDLLAKHPAIFEAQVFPRVRNFTGLLTFIQRLYWIRQQKFDLLINFYPGSSTPTIGRFSGIPKRVSFDKTAKLRKSYNMRVPTPSSYSNWIVETNQIVAPLGIDPASIWPQPKFFIQAEDQLWAKSIIPTQSYAVYQLAASDPAKCWAVPQFAALAEKLYREKQLIPVVVGSPDQVARTDEFFRLYPQDLPSLRLPVLNLSRVAAILTKADILISGDTGIMHLGFAVDTPTVGLIVNRPEYAVTPSTKKMVVFRENAALPKFASGQVRGDIDFSVAEVFEAVEQLFHSLKMR